VKKLSFQNNLQEISESDQISCRLLYRVGFQISESPIGQISDGGFKTISGRTLVDRQLSNCDLSLKSPIGWPLF